MIKILTFLICLGATPVIAQTHYFGFEVGGSWTNIVQDDFIQNNENRKGLTGGFYYLLELENKFQFGLGLAYAQKGFVKEIRVLDRYGRPGQAMEHRYNFDYVTVPLKAGFVMGDKIGAFANLGVVPAFLIKGEVVRNTFQNLENNKQNVTKKANRFDLGALLEIGGYIAIAGNTMFTFSVGFQQDVISITNDDYYPDNQARHYSVLVEGGFKFILNTKKDN